jgi:glycosyltransferase involved in cell wall biosynthesis
MKRDILTDVPGRPGGFWGERTILVGDHAPHPLAKRLLGTRWAVRLRRLELALQLFWNRSAAKAVVTDGGLSGLTFACMQALVPWGRKPHVMVDCNWYVVRRPLVRWFKKLQVQLAARSASALVVWARHEVDDYAAAFGVDPAKLEYIPFHTTLDNYQFDVRDDGYLFAGGNYDRDYRTLIEAVRPLDVPVWLATTLPGQLDGIALPPHVNVRGTSHAGFRDAMAAARLVVVPMRKGLLHSGGQQTCLNAMALGKPTIAVGRKWACDLMIDGIHGLIVDYEDCAGLRQVIRWVLEHPDEGAAMAERGREHAQGFNTRRCMENIYRLAMSFTDGTAERDAEMDLSGAQVCVGWTEARAR